MRNSVKDDTKCFASTICQKNLNKTINQTEIHSIYYQLFSGFNTNVAFATSIVRRLATTVVTFLACLHQNQRRSCSVTVSLD